MAEEKLISVIVPVYNIKEYLPRCVASITAQTYRSLEIILVDDGSTDGTGALCDELAASDSRIRVLHKENGGSSSARNLGIRQARGEYFGFVDSDDYISEDMYALLMEAVTAYDCPAAQVGRDEVAASGERLPDICVPPDTPVLIAAQDFMRELLMHRGDCSFCTKLMHRSLFLNRQFPEGVLNEDFHLLIQMLTEMKGIVSLPGRCYHVFYRPDSNTRSTQKSHFSRVYADNVDNADLAYALVQERWPLLIQTAERFGLYQRLDYLLHIPIEQMQPDNARYREICVNVHTNLSAGLKNPLLTKKNKIYLLLFAAAPKLTRKFHRLTMRLRGIEA
ncbi:MAG: glycosyltransferase [Lachnospiraceae bacterium]|nr:glycosyltransferase [Lachnospiraceae bacterium]